jgi:hypothetical protein
MLLANPFGLYRRRLPPTLRLFEGKYRRSLHPQVLTVDVDCARVIRLIENQAGYILRRDLIAARW